MRSCGRLALRFIGVRREGKGREGKRREGKGKGLGHRYSAAVKRRLLYMGWFCADRCSRVDLGELRSGCGRPIWLMLREGGGGQGDQIELDKDEG